MNRVKNLRNGVESSGTRRKSSVRNANWAAIVKEDTLRQLRRIQSSTKRQAKNRAVSSGLGAMRTEAAFERVKGELNRKLRSSRNIQSNAENIERLVNVEESLRRSSRKQADKTIGHIFDYNMHGSNIYGSMIESLEKNARNARAKSNNIKARVNRNRATKRNWRNIHLDEQSYKDALAFVIHTVTAAFNDPVNKDKVNAALESTNALVKEAQELLDGTSAGEQRLKWASSIWNETRAASRALDKKDAWLQLLKIIGGVK